MSATGKLPLPKSAKKAVICVGGTGECLVLAEYGEAEKVQGRDKGAGVRG